jgi:hypothetical protein
MIGLFVTLLAAPPLWDRTFQVERPAEVTAAVSARCGGCSWASAEKTTAMLVLEVDGRYSQHVALTRGEGPVDYAVSLGGLRAGTHRLRIRLDRAWTPAAVSDVAIADVRVAAVPEGSPEHRARAYAPVLHPRPNELGKYTDTPLIMWYETDETPRGTRIRYSVIFSNEDGGTPADRLLATWGRLTDIEYVLGIEFDHEGKVVDATYQAPSHKILPYRGIVPGRHPVLWVVTDNNMVSDHGTTRPIFAPVPVPFDLAATSREAVMDSQPWSYLVSSQEAFREGRVDESAPADSHHIADPRRYVYVEACAETHDAVLTFGVAVDGSDGLRWFESDGGHKEYKIVRQTSEFPNGCFRGAVALPADAATAPLRAMRFRAYTRPPAKDEAALPAGSGQAAMVRVNKVFRLDHDFLPEASLFRWQGRLPLTADGPPSEIPVTASH